MDYRPRARSITCALAAACLLLASCGGRPIAYGVVLWTEPGGALKTGEVVRIMKESQIQQAYLVRAPKSRQLLEIPMGKVARYASAKEAKKGAEAYQGILDLYAFSERDGLPLREQPAAEARLVYRLRANQLLKVIERGWEKEKIGGYENIWYRILTPDGVQGYCFGEYLVVFEERGDPERRMRELASQDRVLESLFTATWRPESFRDMMEKGRINLDLFKPEAGLFFDRDLKQVRLVEGEKNLVFPYREVERVGPNRYLFKPVDLRVTLSPDGRLVVSYLQKTQLYSAVFIELSEDIESLREAEMERRRELLQEIIRKGSLLKSSAYGTIRFGEEMRFQWEGFERLAARPGVLPRSVQGSGRVDFPFFLGPGLQDRYRGVITFRFAEYAPQEGTSFLYQLEPAGIRFEFVPAAYIEDLEIRRRESSPLIIFFEFAPR